MNRQKSHGERGGRGRGGRGGSRPSHPHVPPSRSINRGTRVNIILKADQPTGRTVTGEVSELLTRGDHPRGVKVRLTDGRVGRVQSLHSGEEPSGSIPVPGDHERESRSFQETENGSQLRTEGVSNPNGGRSRLGARDMRFDEPEEPSSEPLGLDMYIRPTKKSNRDRKTHIQRGNLKSASPGEQHYGTQAIDARPSDQAPAMVVSCPICASFEGDEAAVAHHVAQHFGE